LIGDPRDRQVGDVDFVFADQVEQQIERTGELFQLDDEAGLIGKNGVGTDGDKGARGRWRP